MSSLENQSRPGLRLGQHWFFSGCQFPMLPSRAVNIYIIPNTGIRVTILKNSTFDYKVTRIIQSQNELLFFGSFLASSSLCKFVICTKATLWQLTAFLSYSQFFSSEYDRNIYELIKTKKFPWICKWELLQNCYDILIFRRTVESIALIYGY